jgi:hypothetical protein
MINHYFEYGYNIKFLPDNFLRSEPDISHLEQKGIEVLYGDYYKENWINRVTENIGNIDTICFIDESIADKYLPILKSIIKHVLSLLQRSSLNK